MNKDKIILDNYLLVLKSTIEVYIHGTLESSNKDIKELLKSGLDSTLAHQERTYDKMTENGWYNITNIDTSTIKEALNKVTRKN